MNALSIAINTREPNAADVFHGDQGPQFTAWAFTQYAQQAGLVPSRGFACDPYDSAVIESFWGHMQVELLNRQRWDTRIEPANAKLESIKGSHNPRRWTTYLNWKTAIEFEQETKW